jgi:hypothetical protein
MFSIAAFLPRSPQLNQNGGIFIQGNMKIARGQIRLVVWAGDSSNFVFGKNIPL